MTHYGPTFKLTYEAISDHTALPHALRPNYHKRLSDHRSAKDTLPLIDVRGSPHMPLMVNTNVISRSFGMQLNHAIRDPPPETRCHFL